MYLLLGIALPAGGYLLWRRFEACSEARSKEELNRLQEIAVEDSFPASDPPASW
jgi:hypothetical protein